MSFNPGLEINTVLTNDQICELFGCGTQGGMRRSRKTNTLILISSSIDSVYEDKWINGVLHYTGMGLEGAQDLGYSQNRTLAQSDNNGVDVFLFEKHVDKEYTYVGPVVLAGKPYQANQPDKHGVDRQVWIFPLHPSGGVLPIIPEAVFIDKATEKERVAKKLPLPELLDRVKAVNKMPNERSVVAIRRERSAIISEIARRKAQGKCALCENPAPFSTRQGEPFLEVHHIQWLSKQGLDIEENTVALCPNCHRRMHLLDQESDKEILRAFATKPIIE